MNEYISGSIIWLDKTKALLSIVEFNGTLDHLCYLFLSYNPGHAAQLREAHRSEFWENPDRALRK
jgi:hypothetical protein